MSTGILIVGLYVSLLCIAAAGVWLRVVVRRRERAQGRSLSRIIAPGIGVLAMLVLAVFSAQRGFPGVTVVSVCLAGVFAVQVAFGVHHWISAGQRVGSAS